MNISLLIAAAQVTTPREFGHASLLYGAIIFVLGAARAFLPHSLLLIVSGREVLDMDVRVAAFRVYALLSIVAASAAVPLGLATGHLLATLTCLALFPLLLLQDLGRYIAISAGRPHRALVSDLVWGVTFAGAVGVLAWQDKAHTEAFFFAWFTAGAVAAWPLRKELGSKLATRLSSASLIRLVRPVGGRMLIEYLGVAGSMQLLAIGIAGATSAEDAGLYRAGFTIFGPFNVLFGALGLAVVPVWRRKYHLSLAAVRRAAIWLSFSLAAGLFLALLLLSLRFEPYVEGLFGESGEDLDRVVYLIGLRYVATAGLTGALALLRSAGQVQRTMPLLVSSSLSQLVAGLAIARLAGLEAACATMAALEIVFAALMWRAALTIEDHRDFVNEPSGPGPEMER